MSQMEARVNAIKKEVKKSVQAREKEAEELEVMRTENENIKNVALTDFELKAKNLRQDVKDIDRAIKAAIWSAGSGDGFTQIGVGADTPLPEIEPVEPIIIRPKKVVEDTGSLVGSIRGRPTSRAPTAESFSVKKYEMNASMGLKDPSELSYKHAAPLDILRAHSTGSLLEVPTCLGRSLQGSRISSRRASGPCWASAASGNTAVVGAVADPATWDGFFRGYDAATFEVGVARLRKLFFRCVLASGCPSPPSPPSSTSGRRRARVVFLLSAPPSHGNVSRGASVLGVPRRWRAFVGQWTCATATPSPCATGAFTRQTPSTQGIRRWRACYSPLRVDSPPRPPSRKLQ